MCVRRCALCAPTHGWLQSGGPHAPGAARRAEEKIQKGGRKKKVPGAKMTFSLCSLSSEARNEYFIGRSVQEQI